MLVSTANRREKPLLRWASRRGGHFLLYLKMMNDVVTCRVLIFSRSHMPPLIHCLCRSFFFLLRATHHLIDFVLLLALKYTVYFLQEQEERVSYLTQGPA